MSSKYGSTIHIMISLFAVKVSFISSKIITFQKQSPGRVHRKGGLKNFGKLAGVTCVRVSFLTKLQVVELCYYRTSPSGCFWLVFYPTRNFLVLSDFSHFFSLVRITISNIAHDKMNLSTFARRIDRQLLVFSWCVYYRDYEHPIKLSLVGRILSQTKFKKFKLIIITPLFEFHKQQSFFI